MRAFLKAAMFNALLAAFGFVFFGGITLMVIIGAALLLGVLVLLFILVGAALGFGFTPDTASAVFMPIITFGGYFGVFAAPLGGLVGGFRLVNESRKGSAALEQERAVAATEKGVAAPPDVADTAITASVPKRLETAIRPPPAQEPGT